MKSLAISAVAGCAVGVLLAIGSMRGDSGTKPEAIFRLADPTRPFKGQIVSNIEDTDEVLFITCEGQSMIVKRSVVRPERGTC